jgi:cell division initiation protein
VASLNGDEIFGSSMFGFDKNDVNSYIEKMVKEFEQKIRQKDEEINLLRIQNKELKDNRLSNSNDSDNISAEKNKIVEVLMKAQEKADSIVEEARVKSGAEIKLLENEVEATRERVNKEIQIELKRAESIKNEVNNLKNDTKRVFGRFQREIDRFFEELDVTQNKISSENSTED